MRISDWSSDVCSSDLKSADDPVELVIERLAEDLELIRQIFALIISAGREQAERDDRAAGTDRHVQFTDTGRIRIVLVFMMAIAEDVANGDSAKRDLRIVGNTPYLAVVIAAAPKRSEEHTSELQSLMRISYAFLCLKKK